MSPRSRSLYLDRPGSRRRSSSYSSSGGGGALRKIGWGLAVLLVLVIAGAVAQWTRSVPAQHTVASYQSTVTVPGSSARLPWPKEGQAAVAVGTVGMVGSVGTDRPAPIASLAKMMTAYLVLHDHPLKVGQQGPSLSINSAAVADYRRRVRQQQSVLAVRAGERLSEYKALQALLIPSANNVAAILAGWDAKSQSRFVAKMNATAQRLGLDHTHYDDPDGTSPRTTSTASDQLKLAQQAMRLPVFASIVRQPSATFPVAGTVFNYNYNIGHHGFVGIKTGSDGAAGGCWAFAARRTIAGHPATVYGVVLGQHARNGELIQPALDLGRRLADAVPRVVRRVTVVPAGTKVGTLTAAWRDGVPLRTKSPVRILAAPGQHYDTQLTLQPPSDRSVDAGTTVGQLTVAGVSTPVVVATDAPGPTVKWRLTRL